MWMLYRKSFERCLVSDLGFTPDTAKKAAIQAKPRYRRIIERLREFEEGDRFVTNIVNCAILISFLQSMERRPDVEELTKYYAHAMTILPTKIFCKMGGKSKFSEKDIAGMKKTAALNAADRNIYSWNMDYLPYEDGSGYEARF